MRKIILPICLFVMTLCHAQQSTEKFFPYPEPPKELETLSDRTSFLVQHFWDRCNLKASIIKPDRFKEAFIDYVSFMPYAERDVVFQSIESLLKNFEKDPKNLLTLGTIAEDVLYGDDGDFTSDELYLPFAQAVASNKKISSADKARFAHQARILGQTQVGMVVPDIKFTRPDGTKGSLHESAAAYILLFFNDPDCDDCALARVRLSADYNLNKLIDAGLVKVVSIYPGEADDEWIRSVSTYNDRWIVGAAPDVDENFDLRNPPVFYYLKNMKILSKNLVIDGLLDAFRHVNAKIDQSAVTEGDEKTAE